MKFFKVKVEHARGHAELIIPAASRMDARTYALGQYPGADVKVSRASCDAGSITIMLLLATSLLGTAVCFAYHFIG